MLPPGGVRGRGDLTDVARVTDVERGENGGVNQHQADQDPQEHGLDTHRGGEPAGAEGEDGPTDGLEDGQENGERLASEFRRDDRGDDGAVDRRVESLAGAEE